MSIKKRQIFNIIILFLLLFGLYKYLSFPREYSIKGSILSDGPINLNYKLVEDTSTWKFWHPDKKKDANLIIQNIKKTPFDEIIQKQEKVEKKYNWRFFSDPKGTIIKLTIEGKLPNYKLILPAYKSENKKNFIRILDNLKNYASKSMENHGLILNKKDTILLDTKYVSLPYFNTNISEKTNKMDSLFRQFLKPVFKNKKHIKISGKPFVIYDYMDYARDSVSFKVAIPIKKIDTDKVNFKVDILKGGRYLKSIHKGHYKYIMDSWEKFIDETRHSGVKIDTSRSMFEKYTKGKMFDMNPASWETELYIPISSNDNIKH